MTASELQEEVFKAALDFYSYKEAFKRLFSGDRRWFNFLLRIQGKYLSQQIIKDNREYQAALRQLDEWYSTIQKSYQGWAERIERAVSDVSASVEEKPEQLERYLSEVVQSAKHSYDTLSQQFHLYCQQVVDDVLAKIHDCYHQAATTSGGQLQKG